MEEITFFIKRSLINPQDQHPDHIQEFTVMLNPGESTVLEALQAIQEKLDDSLAFRDGCRFKQCGLCGVTINGNPRMACMTKIKSNMVLSPLEHIPVHLDLVVERKFITEMIKTKKLLPQKLNHAKHMITSKEFDTLSKCTDCQSCLSGCPEYSYENMDSFAGPLFFVKLAQLQEHPQNEHNFSGKAKELGVEKCGGCAGCPCPYGIPIKKLAVDLFLKEIMA